MQKLGFLTHTFIVSVQNRNKLATNKSAATENLSIAILLVYYNIHHTYFLSEATETNEQNTC